MADPEMQQSDRDDDAQETQPDEYESVPAERQTSASDFSDIESTIAAQSEVTDDVSTLQDDGEDDEARVTSSAGIAVPVVSVDGPASAPWSPEPDGDGDVSIALAARSAPPTETRQSEASPERGRASSAMAGVYAPPRGSGSGFRPYSETPVYSENDSPPSPPPSPSYTPPPQLPCSGDWHRKTVDDLISMDVPDVRIPRCVTTWGACEIRGWLRALKLEQYVEALLNNGICGRRLCLLTASNLPRMGITDWQHIRTITGSVRQLLSIDEYVPYERQLDRPPPGRMTRALYLQCARPTGYRPPTSAGYTQFLRQHGFLDVLLRITNQPVVTIPEPQADALYREIAVPPITSPNGYHPPND